MVTGGRNDDFGSDDDDDDDDGDDVFGNGSTEQGRDTLVGRRRVEE